MITPTLRLSPLQQQIVEFNDGALLVVAGPGSGKTRVLTERVRRLLTSIPGHFRILALTFTNKAAKEMEERLDGLGDLRQRAFIGTLHGFCLEMLTDRGKPVGVGTLPQIFEQNQDRKQILLEAALSDPMLAMELENESDAKARNRRLDQWLRGISLKKTHPITQAEFADDLEEHVFEAYNAALRASGGYDFDDLLLLCYQLLTTQPKIADFYKRLYKYICIDEAQDLNEAQYAVLQALCGDDFQNVMMVGDPKQSIYGFNTSSPAYMESFVVDFSASRIELTENFRSSKVIVDIAHALQPSYVVQQQLPIPGEAKLLVGQNEDNEAQLVADEIQSLLANGHPDIEGDVTPARCAILGRTRYTLLAIEKELKARDLPFFKRLSSAHENESDLVEEFQLALRVLANPLDRLHLAKLTKQWGHHLTSSSYPPNSVAADILGFFDSVAVAANNPGCTAIVQALKKVPMNSQAKLDLMPSIGILRKHADGLDEESRRAIYDDTTVLIQEWDQYLRAGNAATRSIGGFLSSMALGTTQQINKDGIALLTVHSSKGLEFEAVFLCGMADGVFPDYRANGKSKELAEEARNAFVAVTRSRRILCLSYPRTRVMPWGDTRVSQPSPYINQIKHLLT